MEIWDIIGIFLGIFLGYIILMKTWVKHGDLIWNRMGILMGILMGI
jgi:hypothetical protein